MKNNYFTLTYVEAFLLSTQSMLAYVLHQQYAVLLDQNNIITDLSSNLKKLNNELTEIKSINTQNTMQASTEMVDSVLTSNISSFIDPKIILGIISTGVIYYYVIPVFNNKINYTFIKVSVNTN